MTFDYGMKNENPIDHMRFYSKSDPDKAVKVRKDQVLKSLDYFIMKYFNVTII